MVLELACGMRVQVIEELWRRGGERAVREYLKRVYGIEVPRDCKLRFRVRAVVPKWVNIEREGEVELFGVPYTVLEVRSAGEDKVVVLENCRDDLYHAPLDAEFLCYVVEYLWKGKILSKEVHVVSN